MRILLQLATVVRLHERDRELADQPRLPSSEQTLPRALVIEGAETLVGRHHRIHDWSSEQNLTKIKQKFIILDYEQSNTISLHCLVSNCLIYTA